MKLTLTVGAVPSREGVWLGVDNPADATWIPLAKFRNQEAANLFLELMAMAGHASRNPDAVEDESD